MDSYVLFERSEGGKPKYVTISQKALDQRPSLPFVITVDLKFTANDYGLPIRGELDRASDLEGRLIGALAPSGAVHLGHITHDGVFKVVFRGPTAAAREITVKQGLFGRFKAPVDSLEDSNWSWYEREMAPTPLEFETSVNRGLLRKLMEHGDRADKARIVEFAALFPSPGQRETFLKSVSLLGYEPTPRGLWEPECDPPEFWCEFQILTTILEPDIASRTLALRQMAAQHGGQFDGWQTPVAK